MHSLYGCHGLYISFVRSFISIRSPFVRPLAHSLTRSFHRAPSVKDSAILHTCAIYYVMCVSGEMRSYIHNDLSAVFAHCAPCCYYPSTHTCVRARQISQPYVSECVLRTSLCTYAAFAYSQQLFPSLSVHTFTHITHGFLLCHAHSSHASSLSLAHFFAAAAAASLNFKIVCTLHIIISYFLAAINKLRFPHHTHNSISCFRTVELVQAVQCVFLIRRLTNAFSFLSRGGSVRSFVQLFF